MRKKTSEEINLADLDVRENEILLDDELNLSVRTKKKSQIPIQNVEFEVVQIDSNRTWSAKIGVDLPCVVKKV